MKDLLYVSIFYLKSIYLLRGKYIDQILSLFIIILPLSLSIIFYDQTINLDNPKVAFIVEISLIILISIIFMHRHIMFLFLLHLRVLLINYFLLRRMYRNFIIETNNFNTVYKSQFIKENSKELLKTIFETINLKFLKNSRDMTFSGIIKLNNQRIENLDGSEGLLNFYGAFFMNKTITLDQIDYRIYKNIIYKKKINAQNEKDILFFYIRYMIRIWAVTIDKYLKPRGENFKIVSY